MEIVWLGHSCFRLRGREATVVTDPCPPSTGYSIGKPTADIATISHGHEDHSYRKALAGSPRVIDGPGEYEVHGAFITGIGTFHDSEKGALHGRNNCFIIELEDMRVCHLGDLGHIPTAEQIEEMTGPEVLLVPIGGGTTLDGGRAAEVVSLLEPRLVIPMHYKTDAAKKELDPPDRFLKEMGTTKMEPQAKLTVTRSSLPLDTQVIVLDYRR